MTPPSIRTLANAVVKKIAAGEIIERPASVLRELLDNAIDAQASHLIVTYEEGGVENISVKDDGAGMGPEDLQLCWQDHTTSKLQNLDDLSTLTTLGFRGEALSSIAAIANLSIHSASTHEDGHRIIIENGILKDFSPVAATQGSHVEIQGLFFNLPARKKFLKSASTESTMLRAVFIDKAAAFPHISFQLYTKGKLQLHLAHSSRIRRSSDCLNISSDLLHSTEAKRDWYQMEVVFSNPQQHYRDRKHIQIFINRRRIREYSLIQAVEYAYRGVMHGGRFPAVQVFLDIDPDYVDVNVHPAKREVKIRRISEIHHHLVSLLKKALESRFATPTTLHVAEPSSRYSSPVKSTTPPQSPPLFSSAPLQKKLSLPKTSFPPAETQDNDNLQYLGQAYATYLIVNYEGDIYFIDQHASHERLLFDRFSQNTDIQPLLTPISLSLSADEEKTLQSQQELYTEMGIHLAKKDTHSWEIQALPASMVNIGSYILDTLHSFYMSSALSTHDFLSRLACRQAIKAGEVILPSTALQLARFTFSSENPHCPHGRPLFVLIDKKFLDTHIGRL